MAIRSILFPKMIAMDKPLKRTWYAIVMTYQDQVMQTKKLPSESKAREWAQKQISDQVYVVIKSNYDPTCYKLEHNNTFGKGSVMPFVDRSGYVGHFYRPKFEE